MGGREERLMTVEMAVMIRRALQDSPQSAKWILKHFQDLGHPEAQIHRGIWELLNSYEIELDGNRLLRIAERRVSRG